MIDTKILAKYRDALDSHPVYDAVKSLEDLQVFMLHHVYSVWDFMSLIKFLQSHIAPTTYPWVPKGDGDIIRFINELVLEEESDETHVAGEHSSHFELYLRAMQEIGADTSVIKSFVAQLPETPTAEAMIKANVPEASALFTTTTFDYINKGKAHEVSALLALGREHIIPSIFRAILRDMQIGPDQAPIFHFYLNRHIHLDEDFHAPLSLKMLNAFIGDDPKKKEEAIEAANNAVAARLTFWDGVHAAIKDNNVATSARS